MNHLTERSKMIDYIKTVNNERFQSEIRHYMGVEEREYPYDEVCALLDHEERTEQNIHDGKRDLERSELLRLRRDLQIARAVLIRLGFYRPLTDEEKTMEVCSGRKKWWNFDMNGVAYTTDFTTSDWFDI